jgi:arylsulfatase A-like enzyme
MVRVSSSVTGRYTHDHRIRHNGGSLGGAVTFRDNGGDRSTLATWLRDAGYATFLVGKYMNEYKHIPDHRPPGWSDWHAHSGGGSTTTTS